MSITKLELELRDVFEPGMAYVALSRATGLAGLALRGGWDEGRMTCSSTVAAFHRQLGARAAGGAAVGSVGPVGLPDKDQEEEEGDSFWLEAAAAAERASDAYNNRAQ